MPAVKTALCILLGVFMIAAGAMHFIAPKAYIRIVPRWLPRPDLIVVVSGICEVLGGAGLLVPLTRRCAAWGLVALFVAIFPANVNMAVNHIGFGRKPWPAWVLWGRLPLQAVLVAWAAWFTR